MSGCACVNLHAEQLRDARRHVIGGARLVAVRRKREGRGASGWEAEAGGCCVVLGWGGLSSSARETPLTQITQHENAPVRGCVKGHERAAAASSI